MQEDKASMELALDSVLAKIDKLNERLTILEKEKEQLVEINEMLLETINEEDDDVERLEKLMEAALASIRDLEKRMSMDAGIKQVPLEDIVGGNIGAIDELNKWRYQEVDPMLEELVELQEIVRQLSVKVDLLEGVKDYQENVKPTFTYIGEYLTNKYKSGAWEARGNFYEKYTQLCKMLNVAPLSANELMKLPVEDFPMQ